MKFSVLMATYCGERPQYFAECLKSLAVQTRPADQIVIVKDGELGPSLEAVIKEYEYLPIKTVLYTGGRRLGGALAFGLDQCEHDVVARMDSDDIAVPTRFDSQLEFLRSTGADVIGGAIAEFATTPGDTISVRKCPDQVRRGQIVRRNPFNHMTVMFRKRSVLEAGGYQPLEGFEDWYLWLRMFANHAVLRNSGEILVHARTDAQFLYRRSGVQYAIREARALNEFRRKGLLSLADYALNMVTRVPARLFPKTMLQTLYTRVLR